MRATSTAGRAAIESDLRAREGSATPQPTFCHEAVIYDGLAGFADAIVPFVRDAVDLDETVLVVLDRTRLDLVRDGLGASAAAAVRFADMEVVGRNPGRLIPIWRDFADQARGSGRPFRGVGEPISPSRSAAAVVECQQHERLLNEAIASTDPFWLLCPYDAATLPASALFEAEVSHPLVQGKSGCSVSRHFTAGPCSDELLGAPLSVPPGTASSLDFEAPSLAALRRTVRSVAADVGMGEERGDDFALALHELATNSILHGGGSGTMRLWTEGDDSIVGEIHDSGRLSSALIGRRAPDRSQCDGRGVWMVHQLCDLVQVRSGVDGTVVRVRMALSDR